MAGVNDTYRTVAERASTALGVQGSEFIGHVTPAETIETAEAFIEGIRTEYADATHNVPAYRVRADPFREYSSDDGEPSGSAGKPALNVLQGEGIENVACVITRYYGGTNLGYGGLVRAYSKSVSEVVKTAGIVEERPHTRFSVTVEYDDSGTVRGIVESAGIEFDAEYGERVVFDVRVPSEAIDEFRDRLQSATSGRAEIGRLTY